MAQISDLKLCTFTLLPLHYVIESHEASSQEITVCGAQMMGSDQC